MLLSLQSIWYFHHPVWRAVDIFVLFPFLRMVTCGLGISKFVVACPNDPGMLDVAGFDAEVPRIVEAFSRGAF